MISASERERYLTREPVQRRPPDAARRRGRGRRGRSPSGASDGVLVRGREPALWWLAQDYIGPDGVAPAPRGPRLRAARRALRGRGGPAARADARRAEGGASAPAARDAHAARADLPALRAAPRRAARAGSPTSTSRSTACAAALWRVGGDRAAELADAPAADRRRPPPLRDGARLPRGGRPRRAHTLSPCSSRPRSAGLRSSRRTGSRDDELGCRRSTEEPNGWRLASPRVYRGRLGYIRVDAPSDELDVELVDALGPEGVTYTPDADEARGSGRRGRGRGGVPAAPADGRAGRRRSPRAGEMMPQKSTFFYPEADVRAALPAAVTDWLAHVPRGRRGRARRARASCPTRAEREPVLGTGRAATTRPRSTPRSEQAVVARFDARRRLHASSPRRSASRRGRGRPVVVDPIDGSLNAKRGIPFFSLSIAVAEGATMGDVFFGYVYDFGAGEEWTARARRGRVPERPAASRERPKDDDRDPRRSRRRAPTSSPSTRRALVGARRTGCGSWARSRSRSATSPPAGSTRSCSLKAARSVDIAAAQLLVRERGLRDRAAATTRRSRRAARPRGPLARGRGGDAGARRALAAAAR